MIYDTTNDRFFARFLTGRSRALWYTKAVRRKWAPEIRAAQNKGWRGSRGAKRCYEIDNLEFAIIEDLTNIGLTHAFAYGIARNWMSPESAKVPIFHKSLIERTNVPVKSLTM